MNRRIGLSLITTWSPVRVRPPAPDAGVAQWWSTYAQSVSYSSVFLAGRRLWVLVDPAIPVQIRSVACDGGATFSTPGNSTVAFLSALFLMSRRHRVIGHWFESNLLHIWGSSSVGRAIPVSLLVHLFFIASRNATIQTQPST